MRGSHEGKLFNDCKFTLLEHDVAGKFVQQKYQGVWFMIDNVCLVWSNTAPPIKHAVTHKRVRF